MPNTAPPRAVHPQGAEAEVRVVGVLARVAVGEEGDHESGNMCPHVPAIGEKCHGTKYQTGDNFGTDISLCHFYLPGR